MHVVARRGPPIASEVAVETEIETADAAAVAATQSGAGNPAVTSTGVEIETAAENETAIGTETVTGIQVGTGAETASIDPAVGDLFRLD